MTLIDPHTVMYLRAMLEAPAPARSVPHRLDIEEQRAGPTLAL
jgi:hypothetical protein